MRPLSALAAGTDRVLSLGKGKLTPTQSRDRALLTPRRGIGDVRLWHFYGKAPTLNTSDPTMMKRAIDMTDDELAAIVAKARLTVVK